MPRRPPRPIRPVRLPVVLLLVLAVVLSASGWTTIRIRRGDTLSAIAARYHTTVAALVALNRLPGSGNLIYAGDTLRIPGRPSTRTEGSRSRTYVVRAGDTVSAIAARYGTTTSWIGAHNRLRSVRMLAIGDRLTLPGAVQESRPSAPFGRTYPAAVYRAAARDRARMARRHAPSRAEVRSLVAGTARRYGLDPALALAIATQESGFRHGVVSTADAVGAMQVLPGTGRYVSRYVVGRRLDLFDARDNVTAGVALLHSLVREAGVKDAVAGYYQGLGSVRSNGMYADTKIYVRSVLALRNRYR